jgi:hypothetical protein
MNICQKRQEFDKKKIFENIEESIQGNETKYNPKVLKVFTRCIEKLKQ